MIHIPSDRENVARPRLSLRTRYPKSAEDMLLAHDSSIRLDKTCVRSMAP